MQTSGLRARPPSAHDGAQLARRRVIARLLRDGAIGRQADLVRLLRAQGYAVTQSSVSRDLRELGVSKAGGRYVLPQDSPAPTRNDFGTLAAFVRELRPAGPSITVLRTATGAAQSVAVAIDRAEWPEVAGTISGDDTIFIATADGDAQRRLLRRLATLFRI